VNPQIQKKFSPLYLHSFYHPAKAWQ